ncbi:hypothetical protein SOVF_105080 [Spinacia oleracea]|nr:hypothetical protein SOVF_105080 [Spinacia oleracea]
MSTVQECARSYGQTSEAADCSSVSRLVIFFVWSSGGCCVGWSFFLLLFLCFLLLVQYNLAVGACLHGCRCCSVAVWAASVLSYAFVLAC